MGKVGKRRRAFGTKSGSKKKNNILQEILIREKRKTKRLLLKKPKISATNPHS